MVDESLLRDTLVQLAIGVKKNYLMLSATLDELAAVRETVRGLDPTFSDVLQERQQKQAQEQYEIVSMQAKRLDALIEQATKVVYYH